MWGWSLGTRSAYTSDDGGRAVILPAPSRASARATTFLPSAAPISGYQKNTTRNGMHISHYNLQSTTKRCCRRLKSWLQEHVCKQNSQSNSKLPRCDVLLFVATPTEKEKLEEVARSLNLQFTRRQGKAFKYYDLGQVGTYRVMAVKSEVGAFGHDGSAARAIAAKIETHATGLVSLGMAFGTDPHKSTGFRGQNKGDVLVSRILLPYDNRRVRSVDGAVVTDYERVVPYHAKESLVKALRKHSMSSEWETHVHFGAMLTGGALIECARFRDDLVRRLSDRGELVIGGEMEGAGLLAASNPRAPTWIIAKGILDFADEERDPKSPQFARDRAIACECAAKFVLTALLSDNPDEQN